MTVKVRDLSRRSVAGIVTGLRTRCSGVRILVGARDSPPDVYRPVLGPPHPSVSSSVGPWGFFLWEKSGWRVTFATHRQPVMMLRISGVMLSWLGKGQPFVLSLFPFFARKQLLMTCVGRQPSWNTVILISWQSHPPDARPESTTITLKACALQRAVPWNDLSPIFATGGTKIDLYP